MTVHDKKHSFFQSFNACLWVKKRVHSIKSSKFPTENPHCPRLNRLVYSPCKETAFVMKIQCGKSRIKTHSTRTFAYNPPALAIAGSTPWDI